MPRCFSIALQTLRWLVVAVCGLVVVATLIMWPRSYFYDDRLLDPDSGLPGPRWNERVVATFGNCFFIDFGELEQVDSLQFSSGLRPKHIARLGYRWIPFGWIPDGGGNETDSFYVDWYCMPVIALGITLIAWWPSLGSWIRLFRFRVYDYLTATVFIAGAGAAAPVAHRHLGDGGTVIAIETCVLLLAAYAAMRYAFGSKDVGRRNAALVAVCCFLCAVGLGLFYWHVAAIFPR